MTSTAAFPIPRLCHWWCNVGDPVIGHHYWHPPLSHKGDPSLRITAFHATMPRAGWVFERAGLGAPWVRTA